jgi:hypothetical protein
MPATLLGAGTADQLLDEAIEAMTNDEAQRVAIPESYGSSRRTGLPGLY